MNQFEQELIRAIEHGCPECKADTFNVICEEVVGYLTRILESPTEIEWYDQTDYESYEQIVRCDECGWQLWSKEDGWIPELAKIVKGE